LKSDVPFAGDLPILHQFHGTKSLHIEETSPDITT